MALPLHTLNPQQYEAVTHLDGPALVLAGAGSGKTRVITFRIAHLVERGVRPSNILGVTFTNKAAEEMRERVGQLLDRDAARQVTLSTFHALGAAILREDIAALGFRTPFTILDEADRHRVLDNVLTELRLANTSMNGATLLGTISRAKNAMKRPDDLRDPRYGAHGAQVARVYDRYNQALRNLNAVDFDDLLLLPTTLLRDRGDLREKYRQRFRYVLVDEYQDTNPIQLELLKQLVGGPHHNLMVVGDDDQSIYAFRGAVSQYILRFGDHFPSPRVISLEQNYRSVGNVLRAANAVIRNNRKRHEKTLWSELGDGDRIRLHVAGGEIDEADFIAAQIISMATAEKRTLEQFAILYRANQQTRALEEALRAKRLPYRIIGGQSLFDRKEIKDIASYLRFVLNPRDELAFRRIVNYPARGIGVQTLAQLDRIAQERGQILAEVAREASRSEKLPEKARAGLAALFAAIDGLQQRLRSARPDDLRELLGTFVGEIGLEAAIRNDEANANVAEVRWNNVVELLDGVGRVEGATAMSRLDHYVSRLSLATTASDEDEESQRGRVTLMTLHSSKGLEFPVVFMCGMSEGLLPHKRSIGEGGKQVDSDAIAEERRLCYVGMTRARERLVLTRPKYRITRNLREEMKASRFLAEIPPEILISGDEPVVVEDESEREAYRAQRFAEMRAALRAGPAGRRP